MDVRKDRFDERLLEPVKAYNSAYKEEFLKNTENKLEELTKQSGINVEENRRTVKELNEKRVKISNLESQLSGKSFLKGFVIFISIVLFFTAAIIFVNVFEDNTETIMILPAVALIGIGIFLLVFCAGKIKEKILALGREKETLEAEAETLLQKAWEQTAPLNALFEPHMTQDLMEDTVPLLDFDYIFSTERYSHLHQRYGFGENTSERKSTIGILSGEINGNPFVIDRNLIQKDGSETYYGSIVIHWTTRERDSDGHYHTVHHSQTLTASVTKFKPYYVTGTSLIYGNDGAPDLHFSRDCSHLEKLNDGELKHVINKRLKQINRKQTKSVKNSGSFTAMSNEEFDAAFGATNRDNEVQFRLMYTPLAQNNTMQLMRDAENYGDDFSFEKIGPINIISSEHIQKLDMDTDPDNYYSYDYDEICRKFTDLNCNYFKNIFFEFAPLLCVPLYQMTKPVEFIYKDYNVRNYTDYEAEFIANKMGEEVFEPAGAATRSILKTSLIDKIGNSDKVKVTANSFSAKDRVDMIPRVGGDGRTHMVPVHWTEYVPIYSETNVVLKNMTYSNNRFKQVFEQPAFRNIVERISARYTYAHGLLCCILRGMENSNEKCREFDKQTTEYLNINRNSNLNNNSAN